MIEEKGPIYFENTKEIVGNELGLGLGLDFESIMKEQANEERSYGLDNHSSPIHIEAMGEGNAVIKHSIRGNVVHKTKGRWKKHARDRGKILETIMLYHCKKRGLIDEDGGYESENGRKRMRGDEHGDNNDLEVRLAMATRQHRQDP